MTLAELRQEVRDSMGEQTPTPTSGLVKGDPELNRWCNRANRHVFNLAARLRPELFLVVNGDDSPFDPENALPMDLGGMFNEELTTSGVLINASAFGIRFANLSTIGVKSIHHVAVVQGEKVTRVLPLEDGFDRFEAGFPTLAVDLAPFRWFVEGQALFFTPTPEGRETMKVAVWFVPEIPKLVDDADQLLMGRLVGHHDLVTAKAAQMLWRKDEEIRTPWDAEVETGERELQMALRRTQQQGRRRVGRAGHYPIAGRRSR